MDFDTLVKTAIKHKACVDASVRDIKDNSILIGKKTKELDNTVAIYKVTKFSYAYLDKLVKDESGRFIKKLSEILNFGVRSIFDDQDYSVEIRVADNNKATIHLVYDDEEGNKLSPDIQICGGGIRTVIGILMQIFFITVYKCENILFLDESLSQVSSQYLPNLMTLVEELSVKNDFKILLITHDSRMMQYANKRYEVSDGKISLVAVDKGGFDDECNSDTVGI